MDYWAQKYRTSERSTGHELNLPNSHRLHYKVFRFITWLFSIFVFKPIKNKSRPFGAELMSYLGTPYLGHLFFQAKCLNGFCDWSYKNNLTPIRVCFSLDNMYNERRRDSFCGLSEEDFMGFCDVEVSLWKSEGKVTLEHHSLVGMSRNVSLK